MPRDERTYQREYARRESRKAVRRKYNQSEVGRAKNNAQGRRWRAANRTKVLEVYKRSDLKRYYGITPEQWDAFFVLQGRCCGVCKSTDPGRKTGHWSTDHDHATGRVRGILCNGCNLALGHAKDDPNRLRMLVEYLEKGNNLMPALKVEQGLRQ